VRTRLLTITLAVVLALLGAVAVLAYARQANQRALDGQKAETVVVASGPIPGGTSLAKAQQGGLLSTEKVPESSLSLTAPAVRSVTAANENKVLSGAVAKGQILLENMLASAASVTANGGFVIPPGKIAVTVNLCIPEGVADYLVPGSYVAVFDTVATKAQVQRTCEAQHAVLNGIANPATAATLLVLQKAEVLAVGQNLATTNTAAGNNVAATTDPSASSAASSIQGEELVTLAVDQPDAQRLMLIDEVGMPYLALLGPGSSMKFMGPVPLFQSQRP
jgi:pilus assembly protein CpaB